VSPTTVYLLYLVFTLGAAGIYFLLPKAGRSKTLIGAVFGLSAVAALVVVLASQVVPAVSNAFYFYVLAVIAVIAAGRVITHPRPVYSAIYFVLLVVAVAALLVLLHAEFMAAALIIVYAGAILVTYLFVIMLAQSEGAVTYDRRSREPFMAVLAGFLLMGAVAGKAGDLPERPAPRSMTASFAPTEGSAAPDALPPEGNTAAMGRVIMTRYVVALEIAGVLLLVAMIGAIVLARKKIPSERHGPVRPPLGQIGKEVEPF